MIVSLIPRPDFAPVPRVELRLSDAVSWDGGGPGGSGPDELDGGSPGTGSAGFDAGSPSTLEVSLPEGTDSVTVWWSSEGRSDKVAGAVRRSVSSSFAHLDVEAGFDVPTSYEVECFAGGVSVGRIPLGEVVLPWTGDPDGCLVQQPLDPNLHATVVNLEGSWPSLSWKAPGEKVYTQGSSYPSLVSTGPRRAAEGVALQFAAPSREVAGRVKSTLGSEVDPQMPVWLVRSHHGFLPRRFYAHVQELVESDFDLRMGGGWSVFSSVVDEIARPAPGLIISPLSYTDINASFGSYVELNAAFTGYGQLNTAWELAGAGGGS